MDSNQLESLAHAMTVLTEEVDSGQKRYLADPRREEKRVYDMMFRCKLIMTRWEVTREDLIKEKMLTGFLIGMLFMNIVYATVASFF